MIKLTFCLRRKPDLTLEEFQTYWREQHAPLVKQHSETLGIRRYVQCHSRPSPMDAALSGPRETEHAGYDGVAELWFDSVEALMAQAGDPEVVKAGAALLEDEAKFIDLANSPIFLGEEYKVV